MTDREICEGIVREEGACPETSMCLCTECPLYSLYDTCLRKKDSLCRAQAWLDEHPVFVRPPKEKDHPVMLKEKRRIYLAGKMRGVPSLNFEEFFVQARRLKELGWQVVNPAEEDVKRMVEDVSLTYKEVLACDINLLSSCDAIYMLKGWQDSPGASTEYAYATACELDVYDEYWEVKEGEL